MPCSVLKSPNPKETNLNCCAEEVDNQNAKQPSLMENETAPNSKSPTPNISIFSPELFFYPLFVYLSYSYMCMCRVWEPNVIKMHRWGRFDLCQVESD